MSRIPRIRRWLSVPAGLAQNSRQPAASSSANWGEGGLSADMCSAVGWLSFRRLADIPFDACLDALESWQRTGQDSELHVRQSLLRGPIEADRDSGTCRIQVRLACRPLRRPLLMRPEIDRWSSSRTAVELTPYRRPAHSRLLPRRPPPAGLLDPLTADMGPECAQHHVSEAVPS